MDKPSLIYSRVTAPDVELALQEYDYSSAEKEEGLSRALRGNYYDCAKSLIEHGVPFSRTREDMLDAIRGKKSVHIILLSEYGVSVDEEMIISLAHTGDIISLESLLKKTSESYQSEKKVGEKLDTKHEAIYAATYFALKCLYATPSMCIKELRKYGFTDKHGKAILFAIIHGLHRCLEDMIDCEITDPRFEQIISEIKGKYGDLIRIILKGGVTALVLLRILQKYGTEELEQALMKAVWKSSYIHICGPWKRAYQEVKFLLGLKLDFDYDYEYVRSLAAEWDTKEIVELIDTDQKDRHVMV